jgi:hypothetical protein
MTSGHHCPGETETHTPVKGPTDVPSFTLYSVLGHIHSYSALFLLILTRMSTHGSAQAASGTRSTWGLKTGLETSVIQGQYGQCIAIQLLHQAAAVS